MRILVMSLIACWAGIAQAEQYWVSYDADDGRFPEECGWTRHTHGGGAVRSVTDGILTLDSMASSMICDYYEIDRPTTPEPGEVFVAEWRMCVAGASGFWENLTGIGADDGEALFFVYHMDSVGEYQEGWERRLVAGAFHKYRLESADMEFYSLWIDDIHVRDGQFMGSGPPLPFVVFGDGSYGTTPALSRTQWDYFRFGVVPEPASAMVALALLTCACVAHRLRR